MSRLRLLLLAGTLSFMHAACSQDARLTPAETAALVQKPDVVVLDVRTPEEYADGHLTGARNIDFKAPDFQERIALLDPDTTYVLYCASGNRSGKTAALLTKQGYKKLHNAGGFKDLKAAGLPTE